MANERRLIDSAELISMLPIVEEDKQIFLIGAVADVVTMISECKPVDAIIPVRCKDCKFYEAGVEYYGGGTKDICRLFKRQMQNKDFCSYGERRCE